MISVHLSMERGVISFVTRRLLDGPAVNNLWNPEVESNDLSTSTRFLFGCFEITLVQRPFHQKGHIYAYARNGKGGISLSHLGLRRQQNPLCWVS